VLVEHVDRAPVDDQLRHRGQFFKRIFAPTGKK
jgi:hypothetical protein